MMPEFHCFFTAFKMLGGLSKYWFGTWRAVECRLVSAGIGLSDA